jgi:erythronate-4-phosphate dehydrogenase
MEIFEKSNIATLHVPLTDEGDYATRKMIVREYIDSLINGSLFINTSRGGIVNEAPLLQRLEDDELYAAIDVWDNEPLANAPLAINAILATHHIAGYSYDGKIRGALSNALDYKEYCGCDVNIAPIEEDLKTYKPLADSVYQNQNELFECLKASRELDEDHEAFLESLSLPDDERARAFDNLRKNYPIRREIL